MDNYVEINIERLRYLLRLFNVSEEELLSLLNEGKKRDIKKEEVFADKIQLPLLKRIDAIFKKGLYYYIDFSPLSVESHASIFFRKQDFNGHLNLEARRVVDHFESLKKTLDTYATLADVSFERKLPYHSLSESAKTTAASIHEFLNIRHYKDDKKQLEHLINQLAEANIYVFEFVEAANKKEKANIEGFYIAPNVIVIKRQSGYLKRELFTLAHELGHCLLNSEEVENVSDEFTKGLSEIEKWCNDFAFHFLMGGNIVVFESLPYANSSNDYAMETVRALSDSSHISMLAIFTRLVIEKKMTQDDYNLVRGGIMHNIKRAAEERRKQASDEHQPMQSPRPIVSNLFKDTMQCALYRGVIDEAEFCRQLNVKPEKMASYLQ